MLTHTDTCSHVLSHAHTYTHTHTHKYSHTLLHIHSHTQIYHTKKHFHISSRGEEPYSNHNGVEEEKLPELEESGKLASKGV